MGKTAVDAATAHIRSQRETMDGILVSATMLDSLIKRAEFVEPDLGDFQLCSPGVSVNIKVAGMGRLHINVQTMRNNFAYPGITLHLYPEGGARGPDRIEHCDTEEEALMIIERWKSKAKTGEGQ